jgi:hypothetical protein
MSGTPAFSNGIIGSAPLALPETGRLRSVVARLRGAPHQAGQAYMLALQLHRPKFFGGMWCWNPDPVDFRRMGLLNVYEDDNAFTTTNGVERSQIRDPSGQGCMTEFFVDDE